MGESRSSFLSGALLFGLSVAGRSTSLYRPSTIQRVNACPPAAGAKVVVPRAAAEFTRMRRLRSPSTDTRKAVAHLPPLRRHIITREFQRFRHSSFRLWLAWR